jgi:amino acid adenylation domain-containing protein
VAEGGGSGSVVEAARALSVARRDPHCPIDLGGPDNPHFRPFPRAWLDRPIFEIFAEVASAHADRIAIDDGETILTYREVHERARDLAWSIARHVDVGAPVAIALPESAAYPVAVLAALAAGRPIVALDLSAPRARNALILHEAEPQAIVVDPSTRAAVLEMAPTLAQIDMGARGEERRGPAPTASPDDIAFIVYTSGSEGRPKGVYHAQRNILHKTVQRITWAHFSAADRTLQLFPGSSSAAQRDILAPLLTGARMYIVDLKRKGLQEVVRTVVRGRITLFRSQPYLFRRLLGLCRDASLFQYVREVDLAGDPAFPSDLALFHRFFPRDCLFTLTLASTEAGTTCHWYVPRDKAFDRPIVPIGYVIPDYEVALVGEDGRPVPRGEVGELLITSRYVALGYWKDAARTRNSFATAPGDPKARTVRSGDLGRMRADGLIELVGRKGRQIKIRGQRVEPAEVEATIRLNPAVKEAAVITRGGDEFAEIVAYVEMEKSAALTAAALGAWLAERLPQAMRPRHIFFLDELPQLSNFKLDIHALYELDRAAVAAPHIEEAAPAPTRRLADPAIAAAVGDEWRRLFGDALFAADRSWEGSGGDSLKALELIFALEVKLGRPVPMSLLGPATRPSDLIALLDRAGDGPVHPDLFFFPGWRGPILHEMRFVQAVEKKFGVKVLDYPPLDPVRLQPFDLTMIVDACLTAVRAAARDGAPLRLLGYSYGAQIAFECARRLNEEGFPIEFLGIVDAPARRRSLSSGARAKKTAPKSRLTRIRTLWREPEYAFMRILQDTMRRRRFRTMAWIWRLLTWLGMRHGRLVFQDVAIDVLRREMALGHRTLFYPGRLCLFRGTETREWLETNAAEDLGWRKFCEGVAIWHVAGDHTGIFDPARVDATAQAVFEALASCGVKKFGPAAARAASPSV